MSEAPNCPACGYEYTYESGKDGMWVCPDCANMWGMSIVPDLKPEPVIRDSVGNVLEDGDTVTVVKTLKVKGSLVGIKAGTKVRNIRLVQGVGDHDIDCKVDGIGPMQLKSSVVKKV
ncbi:zinc ribbon domain-containing protein YjdM [Nocardia sp. NPDC058640]|uniref:zinc ribbon domain-containing protein YjdM n=1 Tax=Nocardia sp. NPDC058640 TaxID=3346571 RepID=UPI0036549DEF